MTNDTKAAASEVEIDITSLDSDLAVMKKVETAGSDPFIKAAGIFALCMTLFHIWTGFHGLYDYVTQRGIHLAFAVSILLLTMPLSEHVFKDRFKNNRPFCIVTRIIDLLMLVAVWVAVFVARDECHHLTERMGSVTVMATIAGGVLFVIVLESARRALGYIMPCLALIFVGYALAGPYLPLVIAHRGYNLERVFKFLATDLDGIFGTTMSVSATVIFMFVMFGAFLEASGCSGFINDIAISLTGRIKSGPALSAVVASAIMGTINGSAVANVVGTGTFTIPLMKSRGYKPEFAGGVESVASTGGQILPPVMGSGAFLMVAFTNEPYTKIVVCAVLPALLYFIGCGFAVVAQAERGHVERTPEDQIPVTRTVLREGWIYLLIIAVLLWCLLGIQLSPLRSALYATASVPLIMLLDRKKRFTPRNILPALKKSGFNAVSIVIGCACAGIVVAMVALTGIGVVFGDMMISASGGRLFLSLLFTAIACIVLGMGLPTTAAYVIGASILAPALVKLQLPLLTAHLFVFYFACLSAITPPVALAAYAGAGIAKCNPMTTAVEACKIGFAGFIVPFVFCYTPAMLMQGTPFEIINIAFSALVGVMGMSMGFQGWYFDDLSMVERLVVLAGGITMVIPGTLTDIIGLVILGLMFFFERANAKKKLAAG